jgi:metal-sulfur cluster biosynthetic enzyme
MPPIAIEKIVSALRNVLDPEVGVNVIDLGLVYGIDIAEGRVRLSMAMTSPACPLSDYLKESAETAIRARVPEVMAFEFVLVWQPPWEPAMMSPEARRQMGWRE